MTTAEEIYDERYAPEYRRLFIEHSLWEPKLRFNAATVGALIKPLGEWLDTCCGQGWHLAQFPHHRRIGIDASAAQLARAKVVNPGVPFIQADISKHEFPEGRRFDLVTNFWSSYSYLNDEDKIRDLVRKLVRWTAPGGFLYLELTVPELLEDFNESEFAAETSFRVTLLSADGTRWQFDDAGGTHRMTSPGLDFFTELISPHFAEIDSATVIRSIRQLVARHKLPD